VLILNVSNILVMGHAQCSGVAAALDGTIGEDVPFLRAWIDLLTPAVERLDHGADDAQRHVLLERDTVLLSMERLLSYPFVAERVRAGALEINGARFGIANGKLEIFDKAAASFVVI